MRTFVLAMVCVMGIGIARAEDAPAKTGLAALVDSTVPDADKSSRTPGSLTAPDLETMQKVYAEVIKGGKDSVASLVGMLVEPGKGEDYKPRYALHGLVTFVDRAENEKDRGVVRDGLVAALGGNAPKPIKRYVLEELKHIGTKSEAEAISTFLNDEETCEFAAQALVAIGGTNDIFRKALSTAQGKNRVTMIQELGLLRDTKAVEEIKKIAGEADPILRLSACEALANIGDPSAADAILFAASDAKGNDRVRLTNAAFSLAQRLLEADNKKDAERIYAKVWETRTDPEERQMRIAALQGLALVRGDLNDLLAAMKTDDMQIRAVAMRAAVTSLGPDGTQKLVAALEKAPPRDRADLLAIVGARRDPAALPAVLAMLKDPEEPVRIAAMQAAAAIGGADAAKAVVDVVLAKEGKEREAAASALGTMRGAEASGIVGAAAKDASSAARAALFGVLATRHAEDQVEVAAAALTDKDAALRAAALKALGVIAGGGQIPAMVKLLKETADKDEIATAEGALLVAAARAGDACTNAAVPALDGAPAPNAASLLKVLGAAANKEALDAVVARAKGDNADMKDAAVRVLAEWREKAAAKTLLDLAAATASEVHQALLLRGVNRLVDKTDLPDSSKTTLLQGVLQAAKGAEAKRSALSNLSNLKTQNVDTLKAAAPSLDDESVQQEACAAVVKIAEQLVKKVNEETYAALREPLDKVIKLAKSNDVRRDAEKFAKRVKKD